MLSRLALASFAAALTSAACFAACATGNTTTGTGGSGPTGSGGSGAAGGGVTSSSSGGQGGDDAGLFDVAPSDAMVDAGPALIYAHTKDILYSLDPTAPGAGLTNVGTFDCVGANADAGQVASITDLAVDQAGGIWAASSYTVRPAVIQGNVIHCGAAVAAPTAQGKFFALTFAPVGVLGPSEVLVAGTTAGELFSIDGQGNVTARGNFGTVPLNDGHGHNYPAANVGQTWELSGDIVFLANNGQPVGFATVRDCPNPPDLTGCNTIDTLIEIDLTKLGAADGGSVVTKSIRGQTIKRAGCNDAAHTDYGRLYGIAAWQDKVYGFSQFGYVVEINVSDGSACLVKDYPNDQFAGAGVTTIAPFEPPQ